MSSIRVVLLTACALAVVAASAPTAAANIDVHMSSSEGLLIQVFVTDGNESNLSVSSVESGGATKLQVTELDNRELTPGTTCVYAGTARHIVTCPVPAIRFVTFRGFGSGARDQLTLHPGVGDCVCDGGSGNDAIRGSDGADLLIGGVGSDLLDGGAGDDVLRGGSGFDTLNTGFGNDSAEGGDDGDTFTTGALADGSDTLDGGPGVDTASYAARGDRGGAVSATIDNAANDGAPPRVGAIFGERDNIRLNVENLTGGAANDILVGDSSPNRLIGDTGNDTLRGGTPPSGGDPATPDDVLDGGLGSDVLQGDGGRDTLMARDAVDDQVVPGLSCGPGVSDRLEADIRDDDTRPVPADCESVDQGMVGEDPNVHIRSARRARGERLTVALRCPRKARRGCAGKLAASRAAKRTRFGRGVRYALRRGKSGVVRVPAPAQASPSVRLRSVERGRLGPRTTLQTLKLRR
jgi:Ca2+-binding RTX toxin-like protein